jgi:hypothetical protein
MRTVAFLSFAALAVPFAAPGEVLAAPVPGSEPGGLEVHGAPALSLSLLAGLTVPAYSGQAVEVDREGELATGPSLQGQVLFATSDEWAFGVAAQVNRVHWRAVDPPARSGAAPGLVESDLTNGFAVATARFIPWPALAVAPLVQVGFGTGFQSQTGGNFHCNRGFIPTGQLALGARARLLPALSILALVSGSVGARPQNCGVSDGPPATPFGGWGLGLHAGATYDLGL